MPKIVGLTIINTPKKKYTQITFFDLFIILYCLCVCRSNLLLMHVTTFPANEKKKTTTNYRNNRLFRLFSFLQHQQAQLTITQLYVEIIRWRKRKCHHTHIEANLIENNSFLSNMCSNAISFFHSAWRALFPSQQIMYAFLYIFFQCFAQWIASKWRRRQYGNNK